MPTSKIEAWVNTYHPAFYTSLTAKESWTYANYASDALALAAWEAYFTNLMSAINGWKTSSKSSRTTDVGRDLIQAIYGYAALHTAYGTSYGSLSSMDAYAIYNIDGFVGTTIGRAVNWYNDMIVTGLPPPYTSVRMAADISFVTTAQSSATEKNAIDAAIAASRSVVGGFGYASMFTDFPSTGTPVSKSNLQTLIFTTLNYQAVGSTVTNTGIKVPPFALP